MIKSRLGREQQNNSYVGNYVYPLKSKKMIHINMKTQKRVEGESVTCNED